MGGRCTPADGTAAAAVAAAWGPLPASEPASDRLPALGGLPLLCSFPAGAAVEVEVAESTSGSAAVLAGAACTASSSAKALATSLSSSSLYLSAAGDVYYRGTLL